MNFNTAVHDAGIFVGLTSDPFSANVSFFDGELLLGTTAVSSSGFGSLQFAGWRSETGSITSIRVDDTSLNGRVTMIDNVTYQSMPYSNVPEPSTLLLIGVGVAAAGVRRVWHVRRAGAH